MSRALINRPLLKHLYFVINVNDVPSSLVLTSSTLLALGFIFLGIYHYTQMLGQRFTNFKV